MTFGYVHLRSRPADSVACPVLLDPSNEASGIDGAETFFVVAIIEVDSVALYVWKDGDPEPTTPTAAMLPDDGGLWFYTVTGLDQGALYHWKALATVGALTSSGCDERTFTTISVPCPVLLSPADASEVPGADSVDLSWEEVSGATYNVYLWADGDPEPTEPTETGITDTFVTIAGLDAGTEYHWRVTAVIGASESSGCGERTFTTENTETPLPPDIGPALWLEAHDDILICAKGTWTVGGDLIESYRVNGDGTTTQLASADLIAEGANGLFQAGKVFAGKLYVLHAPSTVGVSSYRIRVYDIGVGGLTFNSVLSMFIFPNAPSYRNLVAVPDGSNMRFYVLHSGQLSYFAVDPSGAIVASAGSNPIVVIPTTVWRSVFGLQRNPNVVGVYGYDAGTLGRIQWNDVFGGGVSESSTGNPMSAPLAGWKHCFDNAESTLFLLDSAPDAYVAGLDSSGNVAGAFSIVEATAPEYTDDKFMRYKNQGNGEKLYVDIDAFPDVAARGIFLENFGSGYNIEFVRPYT